MKALLAVLAVVLCVGVRPASAGPWTRDDGHFYLNLSYSRISANGFYAADFERAPLRTGYVQHGLTFYGEVGIIGRWLTASLESQLFRYSALPELAHTQGVGDLRLGVWTGLFTSPLRVTLGFLMGLPVGDPKPQPGVGADHDAKLLAAFLPTGNGDFNFEPRLSLGYSFGGVRRWPLLHYAIAEVGYWIRTEGIADGVTYRAELGTKLPFVFVDRFWLVVRLAGVESFASNQETAQTPTGLGNGVTYTAYGFDVAGRIYKGLGASIGADGAFRARAVAAAVNLRLAVSYEY